MGFHSIDTSYCHCCNPSGECKGIVWKGWNAPIPLTYFRTSYGSGEDDPERDALDGESVLVPGLVTPYGVVGECPTTCQKHRDEKTCLQACIGELPPDPDCSGYQSCLSSCGLTAGGAWGLEAWPDNYYWTTLRGGRVVLCLHHGPPYTLQLSVNLLLLRYTYYAGTPPVSCHVHDWYTMSFWDDISDGWASWSELRDAGPGAIACALESLWNGVVVG